ncbi:hypothetical protein [Saccharothrix longispora]|uniref:hypothetical protein n=1 Tax=Saccharothrix longispora TaxID=33920 RepID=UPI0028FD0A57|nr:hypothetical protein [Saccharothrix longispora]MDU0295107.1 hypothetical protein [Saccharothrix longispora]
MSEEEMVSPPWTGDAAVALVDFDNVVPRLQHVADAPVALKVIADELRIAVTKHWSHVDEVRLRLYGGWIHRNGRQTRKAGWISANLGDARASANGILIDPELATATSWSPGRALRGTFRFQSDADPGDPQKAHQKMVDTMIVADALRFGIQGSPVIVMSDDDDLIPGLLGHAAIPSCSTMWLRTRSEGSSCNDNLINDAGVLVETYQQVEV